MLAHCIRRMTVMYNSLRSSILELRESQMHAKVFCKVMYSMKRHHHHLRFISDKSP